MKEAAIFAFGDGAASGVVAEAAFLLRTGWTWAEYMAAPDEVVQAMFEILNAEADAAKAKR